MSEVRIPIGISTLKASLETESAKSKKSAPRMAERGIRRRWEGPTAIRIICGIISPTQPMIPAITTDKELASVATKIAMILIIFTLIPSAYASSSPRLKISKYLLIITITKTLKSIGILMRSTFESSALDKLPINQ